MFAVFNDRLYLPVLQGATIRRDDTTGTVIVARIMRGGAADRSGKWCFLFLYLLSSGLSMAHSDCIFHFTTNWKRN